MLDEPETKTIRRLRSMLDEVLSVVKYNQVDRGIFSCFFCQVRHGKSHEKWCVGEKARQLLYETRIPRARSEP